MQCWTSAVSTFLVSAIISPYHQFATNDTNKRDFYSTFVSIKESIDGNITSRKGCCLPNTFTHCHSSLTHPPPKHIFDGQRCHLRNVSRFIPTHSIATFVSSSGGLWAWLALCMRFGQSFLPHSTTQLATILSSIHACITGRYGYTSRSSTKLELSSTITTSNHRPTSYFKLLRRTRSSRGPGWIT